MFKVGDKVRMLRSSEEGVIIKIKGNIIDIETTDGFELPVIASDLSKVSDAEKEYFQVSTTQKAASSALDDIIESKKPILEQVGLGFEKVNDFLIRPYFINEFNKDILFIISIKSKGIYVNFAAGQVNAKSEGRIYEDLNKNEFEDWSKIKLELLFFGKEKESTDRKTFEIKLKASTLFNNKLTFPFSNKSGFVHTISLVQEIDSSVNKIGLKEPLAFYDNYSFNKTRTVDLHAEKIGLQLGNPDEIFEQQKNYFIKEIDKAIVDNLLELTLIHGTGNGHFKNFIHKYLSSHDQVEWFKEAQKETFGYGATVAHFKP
jgi:hypothetical protein